MTILAFLKDLPCEMKWCEVDMVWKRQHHCPACGTYYELEDEDQSCKISEFYELDVEDCTILSDRGKIVITYTECGGQQVCKSCESEAVNLFERPMTEEQQLELSDALDGFIQWYDNYFDEDSPDNNFHSNLTHLYILVKMMRTKYYN